MKTFEEIIAEAHQFAASKGLDITENNRALDRELYNRTPGNMHLEDGVECDICNNKGFVLRDNGERNYDDYCECYPRRRAALSLKKSGLYDLSLRYTMALFKRETPWHKLMYKKAQSFLEKEGAWFYAGGQVGCGKTHICVAAVAELIKRNIGAKYMLWRDEATRLKGLLTEGGAYQSALKDYKNVPVLYIDDLFKTGRSAPPPSAGDIHLAFEIINHRYNDSRLRTVISSEWTMEELCDFDEGIGSRIFERAEYVEIARDREKNYRLAGGG